MSAGVPAVRSLRNRVERTKQQETVVSSSGKKDKNTGISEQFRKASSTCFTLASVVSEKVKVLVTQLCLTL